MSRRGVLATSVALAVIGTLGWLGYERYLELGADGAGRRSGAGPVPVEAAAVVRGPIELLRTYTGTLEPKAELVVAPKVSGRIEALAVDLSDTVTRGQVVARLDDAEYVQAVAQAEAEATVGRANLAEAQSQLAFAERELARVEKLRERGVASASQVDVTQADQVARKAHVDVARAQLTRAQSALESARIRLGYTRVVAAWQGSGERRVVAQRHVDEGDTVAANAPLLRIVELDPVVAVFYVTEREYARLEPGQEVTLGTDAFPGASFSGEIARIAPVFDASTRQARVEVEVANPDSRLKPGMFVRATAQLDRAPDATIVPTAALVRRDGVEGVFLVDEGGATVSWRPVRVGIRQEQRVQILGDGIDGLVVTLGQQLLDDGAAVTLVDQSEVPSR